MEIYPEAAARHDLDAFRLHLLDAPFDLPFFELEIRDAITQQAADTIGALVERHRVARPHELLRTRHPGRSRADYGDLLAGLARVRRRRDPALGPRVIDYVLFDLFDRDRIIVDIQYAGFFARRRTDAAGKLGKVVGPVQPVDRLAPAPAINQIVPVGNDVAERAAAMAEGNAAIHAARALLLQLGIGQLEVVLAIVPNALGHRTPRVGLAIDLHEARDLSH